jgi:TolA-binding protein
VEEYQALKENRMPRNTKALVLVAVISLSVACAKGTTEPPTTIVPVAAPPVVEVPPPRESAPDAQVAGPGDDPAASDPPGRPAVVAAPKPAPTGPRSTTLEALRDPRARRQPRARVHLVAELKGLEALFATTQQSSPDRPALMRRLADDYVGLEAAAARDGDDKVAAASQRSAIKYYLQLSQEAPKFCASGLTLSQPGNTGCGDEVLYLLAYEYERAAQLNESRKTYFALVQGWPASRYIPAAYLAFGEMFFQEAAADPSKWSLAEASYNQVLKYPPPGNEVYGYALLRLGAVYQGLRDPQHAHVTYEKLRRGAQSHPDWDLFVVPAGLIPAGAP